MLTTINYKGDINPPIINNNHHKRLITFLINIGQFCRKMSVTFIVKYWSVCLTNIGQFDKMILYDMMR